MLKVSKDISLPLDLAGEAIAILGKRGSGKTNTATVFTEELIRARVQTIILDPVGAWWGIRSNAAGTGAGLEVPRLGGQHGDVPLEQTAGALIADVAIDSHQSLLIDLSDFPTKAAVARFVTDFAERLYRRKKAESVLHLVLEEADMFAPQRVKGSERMQGAIEQIVRRGRSRGLGVTLITQRSAVLSKDVLTQADMLVVMRTTGPHDLRAIREWIDSRGDERGAGVLESLPALATGEGWIWNPEHDILTRVQFRARKTFDSSRTPRAGEVRVEPERAAPIDIESLGEQIKATAERVKADDPAALRKKIAELERELAKRPTEEVVKEVPVEVPTPVFNGEIETLESAIEKIEAVVLEGIAAHARTLESAARQVNEAIERAKGVTTVRPPPSPSPSRTTDVRHPRPVTTPPSSGEITRPQQKVLDALAWLESIGLTGDRLRVGFLSGYSPNSGNFNNLLGQLKGAELVAYPRPGAVELTDAGRALAQQPENAVTTAELHSKLLDKLNGPQRKVMWYVLSRHPEACSREEIADATEYSANSGNFNNILGSLKSLGVISRPAPGFVRAEDLLFLE